MKGKYYASYGSNLNIEQMGGRCPFAQIVGTAVLKDYRLLFKGSRTGNYLTVEEMPGHEVPVGVWRVTKADEAFLDRYEGFPRFYYKKTVLLDCSDGKRHRCMIYVMHEDRIIGEPTDWYMDTCLEGYENFGFDRRYLDEAYDYSTKRKGHTR